ncbi:MAG TPA: hypothetical protein EYH59_02695 [Pyrodictium sp.]|nr:hypothetical protein [Pyrodictium sp.]
MYLEMWEAYIVRKGGSEDRKRLPPFATGQIVADYEPLFRYWEAAPQQVREKAMLSNDDFEFLRRVVDEGRVSNLGELMDMLEERFLERIDVDVARRVLSEYYGVPFDPEYARRRLARLLAGWLIEAGTTWKILSLRGQLPHD